jgi:hypothetical protein
MPCLETAAACHQSDLQLVSGIPQDGFQRRTRWPILIFLAIFVIFIFSVRSCNNAAGLAVPSKMIVETCYLKNT